MDGLLTSAATLARCRLLEHRCGGRQTAQCRRAYCAGSATSFRRQTSLADGVRVGVDARPTFRLVRSDQDMSAGPISIASVDLYLSGDDIERPLQFAHLVAHPCFMHLQQRVPLLNRLGSGACSGDVAAQVCGRHPCSAECVAHVQFEDIPL